MAEGKKFGTFGGVFTPSILTILGVIMYLRMGWIVGNAGLWGTIIIILVAHFISVSTGLSISSISTDKKVGAGGVYYVLSRSLGLPIGGALGITLFVATAFSIALYMVGFAEIFNEFTAIGYVKNEAGDWIKAGDMTNSYRITGSIGLLILTIIAFISTSIAIKSQYIILSAIVLSLVSIFFGVGHPSTLIVAESAVQLKAGLLGTYQGDAINWAAIFAIFFPAVTGFTAGVAMSGDLKDPKKAIPAGTMGAIAVGLIVYLTLGIFLHYNIAQDTLIHDPKAIFNWALWGILVYLGVWGATLSSALGGILGGPRILQAMSVDKLTPQLFAKGVGKSNEPRNALLLTVVIAEAGILIGDLDVIAEVVSMFYLAAYGFINLSFFLESWASSDFNPTFKVRRWVGLFGFIATFTVMSQLNLLAMVAAFIIIGGIYFYLSRKQIALGTGDIWQSVWATIVKKGLKRMESGEDHKRNWKPNTLLFSTEDQYRSKMIEFSKAVSGQAGIITNFDLHENPNAKVLFPKNKEYVKDEELEKYGIFGRKLEVQNIFKGIESIACTFGFSGIEPNTILMNWPGQTKDPKWFTSMTEKLIALDYNVLYLDYDKRWGFRKKERIDLWWAGIGNNAELTLSLAKFITSSPDWSQANIRILLVNDTNVDFRVVEHRIQHVVDQFRVKAEIKVVNNEVDQKPVYELMKIHSIEADLVLVGIPEINENDRDYFVDQTNNLVSIIGTTLLVKASSQFDETDLKLEQIELKYEPQKLAQNELVELLPAHDSALSISFTELDVKYNEITEKLVQNSVQQIENYHHEIFAKVMRKMDLLLQEVTAEEVDETIENKIQKLLDQTREVYADALTNNLPLVYEKFEEDLQVYFNQKENLILNLPRKITVNTQYNGEQKHTAKKRKIQFQNSIQRIWYSKEIKETNESLLNFGYQNLILLHQSKNILHTIIWQLLDEIQISGFTTNVLQLNKTKLDHAIQKIDSEALHLSVNLYKELRNNERNNFNALRISLLDKKYKQTLHEKYPPLPNKTLKKIRHNLNSFPSYWYRNLILFSYHLEADIYLISYAAKIRTLVKQVKTYTQKNYLVKIEDNITALNNQLTTVLNAFIKGDDEKVLGKAIRLNEELFFNSAFVINQLIEQAEELVKLMPTEIELMTAKSINAIREEQGAEIVTEQIALQEITAYLVRTNFVDPLHERIQVFYEQLKRIMGKLAGATLVVQKGIDSYSINKKAASLKEVLSNVTTEINALQNDFDTIKEGFAIELKDREEVLRKELNINQIIEQVEKLRQYVKLHKRRSGVLTSLKEINQKANKKVSAVFTYLAKKQRDISAIEYKKQYRSLHSEQALLAQFTSSILPCTHLPYYYQQLFTGTHYSESKTLDNRKDEIAQIEAAINWIDKGKAGGILILGEAGAGKTYLTAHITNRLRSDKVYKIVPPVSRVWKKEDLYKSIQRITGIEEPIQRIFLRIPEKSIIIIEDLEQWWLKTSNGNEIINEISKLINKYGNRHYFILSSNIHAFKFISFSTTIQNAIIQSVILTPMTASQIKDIIWSRHQTGGLRAEIEGVNQQHLSISKLNKFLNRFYTTSNGNVGLALNQWISSISEIEDNLFKISNPAHKEIPFIANEHWKNLIFQLFIHKNLALDELYRIYGEEDKTWINRILQSLKTTELVYQNERGEFVLNDVAKPYIENWLDEVGYIK